VPPAKRCKPHYTPEAPMRNPEHRARSTRPLYNYQEAAELLHTTARHVERLVADGRLSYLRVGHFVRFSPMDIDEFLAACRVNARGADDE
jgi:excisionase family DNA binding protein